MWFHPHYRESKEEPVVSLFLSRTYMSRHFWKLGGDSMKMSNTFWPNLAMKTWFFTHVLDRSPRNAYIPCEFWLVVKTIAEYYVGFQMIFKKNIPMSLNVWNFAFNELCDLKNLKKLISGSCPTPIIESYINNYIEHDLHKMHCGMHIFLLIYFTIYNYLFFLKVTTSYFNIIL